MLGLDKALNIVFMGSSDFAIPALELLAAHGLISLVVTRPPKPAGRGQKVLPTPVSVKARELGLKVFEEVDIKNPLFIPAVKEARPDLLVVADYGGFLNEELLTLCQYPPLNIHPSLLPKHRGPAPVNWAILAGDEKIGVSIIFLVKEMDAGPILKQKSFNCDTSNSAIYWENFLALEGAKLLLDVIDDLKSGKENSIAQDETQATQNRLLKKSDGFIDWSKSAIELVRQINGLNPWPGSLCIFKGKDLKLFDAKEVKNNEQTLVLPGTVMGLDENDNLRISTGNGYISVGRFQMAGKKLTFAADFWRGYRPDFFESKMNE